MGLLSVLSTPLLCNLVGSYCTLVIFAIVIYSCSRGSHVVCPNVWVLFFNLLNVLSIPRIAISHLQLHNQGKEMSLQENFFGLLYPAVIASISFNSQNDFSTYILVPRINVIFDPVSKGP